jgi:flagellar biosynthesis/type III secretory pathway ATPase
MEEFLRQPVEQSSTMEKTLAMMKKIFAEGN